jgi:hypothetical protein
MKVFKLIKSKAKQITTPTPTVEQIHREFYSVQTLLLEENQRLADSLMEDEERIATAKEIQELGFYKASNIGKPLEAISKLEMIKNYNQAYPNYKFIDEGSVKAICEKYTLYLCGVYDFIAEIPLKNQKEILAFRVKEKDCINQHRFEEPDTWGWENKSETERELIRASLKIYNELVQKAEASINLIKCHSLKIIAPESQIDMRYKEKKGYQIVQKDPIVLQPVKGGYLIVTAWGDEASDELVVNEKMN